jgi:3-isopropylmalate/(R)-2-methylmalate dehydratase small subunit
MNEPFVSVKGLVAPLPVANIDTDIIVPARFLTLTGKAGLGEHAFADWRKAHGFVLDDPKYASARILLTGENFGCGSSREQAVWALAELGIRCIIAPSFGEIFRSNAVRNGMLPITLGELQWSAILRAAEAAEAASVDLEAMTITLSGLAPIGFSIPGKERSALLSGCDEIDDILAHNRDAIAAFEARQRETSPWLWDKENTNG